MIITVCLPPPPDSPPLTLPNCRSFSDLQHMQEWMKEHGITMPCNQEWRWP